MKPPPDLEHQHYPDSFDSKMAYQLRERYPTTLEDMQNNAVRVEANLMIKKSQLKHKKPKKRVTIKEEPSSSTNLKLDSLMITMERMADQMIKSDRSQEPQVRNPNFRNRQQPQYRIKQREQKDFEASTSQQPIQTPLQQSYAQGEYDDETYPIIEENHLFREDHHPIFLTEDEKYAEKVEDYILAPLPGNERFIFPGCTTKFRSDC